MTMFGLMTVKAHEAAMRSADAKAYEAWSKAIDERNAANAEIEKRKSEYDSLRRDYSSLRRDYDTRGDLLAKAREEANALRSEEHTSELQSLMRSQYAVFCLEKKILLHTTPLLGVLVTVLHSETPQANLHTHTAIPVTILIIA